MLRVSLDRFLERHNLTAYRLVKATQGRVARGSVYALARGKDVKRVDLDTLNEVMNALERLTGQSVTPNDLLEVVEAPQEDDTAALLEAGAVDLGAQLAELEKDTPKEELDAWLASFEARA